MIKRMHRAKEMAEFPFIKTYCGLKLTSYQIDKAYNAPDPLMCIKCMKLEIGKKDD